MLKKFQVAALLNAPTWRFFSI